MNDGSESNEWLSAPFSCPVCRGDRFAQHQVLWPELIEAWELSEDEVGLVERQQGFSCASCGSNLRSMTMAAAMLREFGSGRLFRDFVERDSAARKLRLLEINAAGQLSPYLSRFRRHTFAQYPDIDIQAMPYADGSFDLVVHGDTLEHVPEPVAALRECGRVLSREGKLFFTIPIVPSRLTRRRVGLPPSYHGFPDTSSDDYIVHTEYGADFYLDMVEAGFTEVRLHTLGDASSFCVVCNKP
jgi:SAM-dependent methyltransferase